MRSVHPSEVKGAVDAPPSKSMMQRAVAASLLARGTSKMINPSFCNDVLAAMSIAESLGARIKIKKGNVEITGGLRPNTNIINCGESGLAIRMFSPIVALSNKSITLTASGSLAERPVGMVEDALTQLGAVCRTNGGFPPLAIRGPINGGKIRIDGSTSSQIITGLLMALPLCRENSEIVVSNLKSRPYVRMTINLLKEFGITIQHDNALVNFRIRGRQAYRPAKCRIEGDWSAAAFLLVAGAIAGKVAVKSIDKNSEQADKAILTALINAGADVVAKKGRVIVSRDSLNCFKFDATECPDLFPPLVALACNCKGKSVIKGAERLRHKESDRASVLVSEFRKLGADIKLAGNAIEVIGKTLKGGKVNSHNDHRIAMACAIAALNADNPVRIEEEDCVSKSYPDFFEDLDEIRVEHTISESDSLDIGKDIGKSKVRA